MQISAANLLLASQQAAPAGAGPATPAFSAALHKATGFTPPDFTKTEPPIMRQAVPPQTGVAQTGTAPAATRPGMHINLTV